MLGAPLPVGSLIPEFHARDQQGRDVSHLLLRGRWVVLVFYVADDTPG
jgi:peroxiredoxin